jgi:hypothetical protein
VKRYLLALLLVASLASPVFSGAAGADDPCLPGSAELAYEELVEAAPDDSPLQAEAERIGQEQDAKDAFDTDETIRRLTDAATAAGLVFSCEVYRYVRVDGSRPTDSEDDDADLAPVTTTRPKTAGPAPGSTATTRTTALVAGGTKATTAPGAAPTSEEGSSASGGSSDPSGPSDPDGAEGTGPALGDLDRDGTGPGATTGSGRGSTEARTDDADEAGSAADREEAAGGAEVVADDAGDGGGDGAGGTFALAWMGLSLTALALLSGRRRRKVGQDLGAPAANGGD